MPELVVTCEHGGPRVPPRFRALFAGNRRLLDSHRGYDAGALDLARHLARQLAAPLIFSTVTRLLADLNRSETNRHVWSDITRALPPAEKRLILDTHYHPYRSRVEETVRERLRAGSQVVHLSVHSFTPVLRGRRRPTDVGLLYDPARDKERTWCQDVRRCLRSDQPDLRVHMNRPYQGRADGLTTCLRATFPPSRYLGIELEINQRLLSAARRFPAPLQTEIIRAVATVL
jgi:predicted N-formylglutamate amidohydrolase